MQYKAYTLSNFRTIPQVDKYLSEDARRAIDIVGKVLPFKVNNYVIEELIDWDNYQSDPIFHLCFPQRAMLNEKFYNKISDIMRANSSDSSILSKYIDFVRRELNPNPSGQMEFNVPHIDQMPLNGVQHKYKNTALLFPSQGQTCHSYCTFCFRWSQFVGDKELKFIIREVDQMMNYIKNNKNISDILFTGGDPMVMNANILRTYIQPLLSKEFNHIKTIRIGTKSLGFWPYKFINENKSDDVLKLFDDIVKAGKHLAFMAHFSHPVELGTDTVKQAIKRIQSTGAVIRTQSPILKHINDSSLVWKELWEKQVQHGCIPYYMFIPRDTGTQDYFSIPLIRAWQIFTHAYQQVTGIARTVRGPSMSTSPGKILIQGPTTVNKEEIISLCFLQGRNSDWVNIPFFAKNDMEAVWIDDLVPAFGDSEWFWSKEYEIIEKINNL